MKSSVDAAPRVAVNPSIGSSAMKEWLGFALSFAIIIFGQAYRTQAQSEPLIKEREISRQLKVFRDFERRLSD